MLFHHPYISKHTLLPYLQPAIWFGVLAVLFVADMSAAPSLCIFKWVGFGGCPGCGIGHAIHHALHLQFAESVAAHKLGLPAVGLILYTIIKPLFAPKLFTNGYPANVTVTPRHAAR